MYKNLAATLVAACCLFPAFAQKPVTEPLKIGFVYPDNEESVARNVDPEVSFRIGKHSGKIIGIDLAAGLDPLKRIGLLTHRIHQSIPALTRVNQRLNYRLIGDVLNAQARMHLGS